MCGIFGIYGHPESCHLTLMALAMLGHRGQTATGMAGYSNLNPLTLKVLKGHGPVERVLSLPLLKEEEILDGSVCIGHTRWPTQRPGNQSQRQIQPHYAQTQRGRIALASNGDIVNMDEQRHFLEKHDIRIYSENDAEIVAASIVYQMVSRGRNELEAIFQVMDHIKGSFSAVMMTEFGERLYAFCDPRGIRPLIFAQINQDGRVYFVVTSEDCVINNLLKLTPTAFVINKQWLGPGEVVMIENGQANFYRHKKALKRRFCIFEYVYFSRPDSCDELGRSFYSLRKAMGVELAREHSMENGQDIIVVPVPEGGLPAALGYAETLGLRLEHGIVIERSYGRRRTFIDLNPGIQAALKYQILPDVVKGQKVVLVDDSIVRGTTSSRLTQMLRKAGAREVHFRIPSPPYRYPCDLGVETRDPERLVAARAGGEITEIKKQINHPDSLAHLSLKGLKRVISRRDTSFCDFCFSGRHPLRT